MNITSFCLTLLAASLTVAAADLAEAQSAANVAVIINDASDASVRVGQHYIDKRGVPAANVIRIRTTTDEEIARGEFTNTIEQPIATALSRGGLQDRILYLVLTKGIPLRVIGSAGADGTVASVDSELSLLYRKMSGVSVPVRGRVDNPYFLAGRAIGAAQRFTHRAQDIFLVARLDGFTVEDAIALIDRAQVPARSGRVVLDQRATVTEAIGDRWLQDAASRLRDAGLADRIVLEATPRGARETEPILGYYSWGSNDPANRVRSLGIAFVPGAIAGTFLSTDARTFRPPPDGWAPSATTVVPGPSLFAGSAQSLTGDLIREGVTGVAGHVAEPYLQSAVRPEILFPAYLAGFNLVEAFYLAIPHLSWQTVVVGDPLCSPFAERVLTDSEIEEPLHPDSELPALFSKRRADEARRAWQATSERALLLMLAAESRFARGDAAGVQRALEEATGLEPGLTRAQLQLALTYEQAGQFSRAVERYRLVLQKQPRNAVALNNLAYALAVGLRNPSEARPLAQRAVAFAPSEATMIDTLAWIEHLLGNHAEAARLIPSAVRGAPQNGEVRLHAAFIFAAMNIWHSADSELQAAVKIAPSLVGREDVQQLQAQILKARGGSR
jgi:uncharacterized protein (TIGR03790 family)